ncbi:MAG TPA: hypothetical protein DCY13_02880 [Verrucomicrobiales bacterium]|nr:hypothetical protein [Verrucomicrobiales bacterium]
MEACVAITLHMVFTERRNLQFDAAGLNDLELSFELNRVTRREAREGRDHLHGRGITAGSGKMGFVSKVVGRRGI